MGMGGDVPPISRQPTSPGVQPSTVKKKPIDFAVGAIKESAKTKEALSKPLSKQRSASFSGIPVGKEATRARAISTILKGDERQSLMFEEDSDRSPSPPPSRTQSQSPSPDRSRTPSPDRGRTPSLDRPPLPERRGGAIGEEEPTVAAQPVEAQPVAAQPVEAQPVAAQPVEAQPVEAEEPLPPKEPVEAEPIAAHKEPAHESTEEAQARRERVLSVMAEATSMGAIQTALGAIRNDRQKYRELNEKFQKYAVEIEKDPIDKVAARDAAREFMISIQEAQVGRHGRHGRHVFDTETINRRMIESMKKHEIQDAHASPERLKSLDDIQTQVEQAEKLLIEYRSAKEKDDKEKIMDDLIETISKANQSVLVYNKRYSVDFNIKNIFEQDLMSILSTEENQEIFKKCYENSSELVKSSFDKFDLVFLK